MNGDSEPIHRSRALWELAMQTVPVTVPLAVGVLLEHTERQVAALGGIHSSGVALTDRRLIAWRAGGPSPPIRLEELSVIEEISATYEALIFIPADGRVALLLLLETGHPGIEAFLNQVEQAVRRLAGARRRGVRVESLAQPPARTVRYSWSDPGS